jgi:hypothetical protein
METRSVRPHGEERLLLVVFLDAQNEIHFPLGEKFGSVSQPHSPPPKGFLVTRRRPVPFARINQTPLLPGAMSRSYTIHFPSDEKEGCP